MEGSRQAVEVFPLPNATVSVEMNEETEDFADSAVVSLSAHIRGRRSTSSGGAMKFARQSRERIHPWLLSPDDRRKEVRCPLVANTIISELEHRMTSERSEEEDPLLAFKAARFLWELVSHMFQPLILPVTLAVDGRVGAMNKYLWATCFLKNPGLTPIILQAFPFILAAALFSVWYFELEELYVDMTLTLILYFYRNCVIATKYAFYPDEAYAELHKTPDADLSRYLVASWSSPDATLMEAEVLAAQQKTKIDLRKQSFYLQHPDSLCFLTDDEETLGTPNYDNWNATDAHRIFHVSASDVLTRMVKYMLLASGRFRSVISRFGQLSTVFILLALWVPFKGSFDSFTPLHWIVKSVLSLQLLFLWGTAFVFLMAAVIHYHRLGSLMTILLWSVGFTADPGGVFVHNKISFQIPENIYAWFRCREVALDLGYRFQARITAYVSIALVMLASAVGAVTLAYLGGFLFPPRVVLTVLALVIPVAASLAAVIFNAARANHLQVQHSAFLALEKLEVHSIVLSLEKNDPLAEHLDTVSRALEEAKRGMDGLYDAKPVCVFGVRASFEMLTTFATAFGTASAFGIRLLVATLDH